MAGGRGRRLLTVGTEKPLLEVGGLPLIARVAGALEQVNGLPPLLVATSPHTPATERYARSRGWEVVRTPGAGYASDVAWLACRYPRFFTVASDLPFLRRESWRAFLEATARTSVPWVGLLPAICLPRGGSPSDLWSEAVPGLGPCRVVGVNMVAGPAPAPSRPYLFADPWVGVNVNTPEDLRWAEGLLSAWASGGPPEGLEGRRNPL